MPCRANNRPVTRLSSQATALTRARTSRARRLISAALPIGVATIIRPSGGRPGGRPGGLLPPASSLGSGAVADGDRGGSPPHVVDLSAATSCHRALPRRDPPSRLPVSTSEAGFARRPHGSNGRSIRRPDSRRSTTSAHPRPRGLSGASAGASGRHAFRPRCAGRKHRPSPDGPDRCRLGRPAGIATGAGAAAAFDRADTVADSVATPAAG